MVDFPFEVDVDPDEAPDCHDTRGEQEERRHRHARRAEPQRTATPVSREHQFANNASSSLNSSLSLTPFHFFLFVISISSLLSFCLFFKVFTSFFYDFRYLNIQFSRLLSFGIDFETLLSTTMQSFSTFYKTFTKQLQNVQIIIQ